MEGTFDPGRALGGLVLALVGAAVIAAYPRINRAARGRGPDAHWRAGWVVAALGMGAMGAGWALLASSGPRLTYPAVRAAGAVVGLVALVTYLASARWVGRWRTPETYSLELETRGIYRRVRHPQALSLCLASVGVGLLAGSVPYLISVPLWIAFWTAYTYIEEAKELVPAFGESYLRYRETTPRLIPRLRLRTALRSDKREAS